MVTSASLYSELAPYYDKIYHWKDYRKETRKLKELIRKNQLSSGADLLDVACGTGRHLSYLRKDYDCTGVDNSNQMLAVAKRNNPGVPFTQGSMLDFDLGRQFDVILCVF